MQATTFESRCQILLDDEEKKDPPFLMSRGECCNAFVTP
jgi:hypothetical protein